MYVACKKWIVKKHFFNFILKLKPSFCKFFFILLIFIFAVGVPLFLCKRMVIKQNLNSKNSVCLRLYIG